MEDKRMTLSQLKHSLSMCGDTDAISEEALRGILQEEIWSLLNSNYSKKDKVNLLSILDNEITRRVNKELLEKQIKLSEETRKDNKRTSIWTLGLAVASLLFSLTAVRLSYLDYKGDETWQNDQITELKKISNQSNQNEQIIELLKEIKNKKIIVKRGR